jgi:hypothetical protein
MIAISCISSVDIYIYIYNTRRSNHYDSSIIHPEYMSRSSMLKANEEQTVDLNVHH